MVCLVKLKDPDRFVPSCATLAVDGMRVESETAEIHALRRTVLELLLSDHDGAAAPDPDSPAGCEAHGCTKHDLCRLRKYAQMYAADPTRFHGVQRQLAGRAHEHPEITYDPRKCILCGICIQLAQQAGEPLGLTLIGRGFDMRVDVPLNELLHEALRTASRRVAAACPTGALARRPAAKPGPKPQPPEVV
jgi:NADH dehydrogenase/NADH:ubiquinone oxidoreductase subunit G